MPIAFDQAAIEEFFGVKISESPMTDLEQGRLWIDYSGVTLKYSMVIDIQRDTVMISGDPKTPWGGDSMYEIGVPCTSIHTQPSGYDPDGIALAFFYGDRNDRRNRMLTIIKRRDTDLVVWPSWPYPVGHPNAYPDDEP